MAPLTAERRLDLDKQAGAPLTDEEVREMTAHLAFIKRYKAYFGLSFNATEDLLVNGQRPPTDRGVCKHLLSKIDRKAVERALAKEAVRADAGLRARLLAGVVRINADPALLLFYLEALTAQRDKRDAAAAFRLTVDRIDFDGLSNAQVATLLEVIERTFEGHDRLQALFGLLGSESFERALGRALPTLPPALAEVFAPLRAAERVIVRGLAPADDAERALAEAGAVALLGAPDEVRLSHPPEVRARLATWAVELGPAAVVDRAVTTLVTSLEAGSPLWARLALGLADRHLAAGHDEPARALLNQLLQAAPTHGPALARRAALGWPRVGRVALEPATEARTPGDPSSPSTPATVRGEPSSPTPARGRLRRAFWLERAVPVWARGGGPREAERLAREHALHAAHAVPGMALALGSDRAPDGALSLLVVGAGVPLVPAALAGWTLGERLALAAAVARVLHAVAERGLELPDAAPARFLATAGAPHAPLLADLDGVVEREPSRALARHADLARRFARGALGADAPESAEALPLRVHTALRAPRLDALAAALTELAAAL